MSIDGYVTAQGDGPGKGLGGEHGLGLVRGDLAAGY